MKKFAALLTMSILANTHAVILLDTGEITANTNPTGTIAETSWQYEGIWGGFLGTPIAPHFFISAAHIGQAGGTSFSYQGSSYTIAQSYSLPGSDLLIWKVREEFPTFAPLYSKSDEIGKHLVVIGRGTQRGSEVMLNNTLRGWYWGAGDSVERWGENDIADVVPYYGHDLLYATFDQHVLPNDHSNESHLSSGDSGGAVFIKDGGWKLAGINYSVDDLYTEPAPSGQFVAAIFDARGYYSYDGTNYTQITGLNPVPTGFYASRISSELPWICSVIADPQIALEGNFLTLTYSRLIAPATDIIYTVKQSTDLISWTTATVVEEPVSTAGDIERIKAKVDIGAATTLFLRLSITRP